MKETLINTIVLVLLSSCYRLATVVSERYYQGVVHNVYGQHFSCNPEPQTIDEFLTLANEIPDQADKELLEDIKQFQKLLISI